MSVASPSSAPPRVLVTGLSGFTGAYLREDLANHGYAVAALPEGTDLRDPRAVRAGVAGLAPDYVIHLAGISFVGHGDPAEIYAVNTVGAMHLLDALAVEAPRVRKVVLASSANVYGNATVDPILESTPPRPVSHYACSKLAMEHLARTYFDRLPIVLTRPFNYTGVGQTPDFLVPKLVRHFAQRAPRLELGNLDVVRDFSDVRAVAAVYRKLLACEVRGEVVNICSGVGRSLRSVVQALSNLCGYAPEIVVNPDFVRSAEVHRLVGSRARLDAAIGAVETPDFEETLAWMLANASGARSDN